MTSLIAAQINRIVTNLRQLSHLCVLLCIGIESICITRQNWWRKYAIRQRKIRKTIRKYGRLMWLWMVSSISRVRLFSVLNYFNKRAYRMQWRSRGDIITIIVVQDTPLPFAASKRRTALIMRTPLWLRSINDALIKVELKVFISGHSEYIISLLVWVGGLISISSVALNDLTFPTWLQSHGLHFRYFHQDNLS